MKNPMMSLWLSSANQAVAWWSGHAANAVRAQQRLALDAVSKAATGSKPKRKRPAKKRRTAARRH